MGTAIRLAWELLRAFDAQLVNIVLVTLRMSLTSSVLALLIGAPVGTLLACTDFPGKRICIVWNRTWMGMPPVVCGLLCYILFSGVGPLGKMQLLFTVPGMVIAQVILITPIVIGSVETYLAPLSPAIRESARGLGLSRTRTALLILHETRYSLISTYLTGFSRAIAEVGAVSMVGGAIAYKTNVMSTAIMMYSNRGDFTLGLALGILLLLLSLLINIAACLLQARMRP